MPNRRQTPPPDLSDLRLTTEPWHYCDVRSHTSKTSTQIRSRLDVVQGGVHLTELPSPRCTLVSARFFHRLTANHWRAERIAFCFVMTDCIADVVGFTQHHMHICRRS